MYLGVLHISVVLSMGESIQSMMISCGGKIRRADAPCKGPLSLSISQVGRAMIALQRPTHRGATVSNNGHTNELSGLYRQGVETP